LDLLLREADLNKDGLIQYEEFITWIMGSGGDTEHERRVSRGCFKSAQWVHMKDGKVTDFYDVGGELGVGGFGSVSKAVHLKTKKTRAIKTVPKSRMTREHFDEEIEMMKEMDHPNITQLYEVYQDDVNYYLVMELLSGGELFDYIVDADTVTEKQVAYVMRQMLGVMNYMHSKDICHRDVKPENFMLKEKGPIMECTLKVIDFGLAKKVSPHESLTEAIGTPEYMAPEMVTKVGYGLKVDSWACGVVMFILFSGCSPFAGDSDDETIKFAKRGLRSFEPPEVWNAVSSEAKDLISGLLDLNPKKRLSVEQALNHSWMVKLDSDKLPNVQLSCQQLENMKAFSGTNKLKKAALHLIARRLNCDEILHLREIFISMDKNKDGKLTYEELKLGIKDSGFDSIKKTDRIALLEAMDVNWTGVINYTEFLAASMEKAHYAQESVCWSAFHMFDRDGNGVIDRKELAQVLHNSDLEACVGSETIAHVLEESDTNQDGVIDFNEFMGMMRRTTESKVS
jgi:calcium-dependent protein kinase